MTFQSPKNKSSASSSPTMLGPGFRFHPTDEELVQYYLRRKAAGKLLRFDAISEIDIYKTEPWDLPHMSKMKTRDLEWYFFSMLDKKYGNGARTNRATEKGYWKTTGKDRAVYHKKQVVGMKKTLVYHNGRAPKGQRTNWVMHEYRLVDNELETARTSQDAFVICRVFQKSGSGPKNGEQYGAPFVEEEWNDDDLELVPENEVTQEVDFDSDAWLDYHDLQQILGSDMPSSSTPISVNFQSGDGNNVETAESSHNMPTHLMTVGIQYGEPKLCGSDMNINNCPPYDADVNLVNEHIGECSKSEALGDTAYLLLDEPFLDSSDNLEFLNGGFIEASDFSKAIENDYTASNMLDEYLTFFDADDNNSLSFTWDIQGMDNGTEQADLPNGPHIENSIDNKPDAAVSSEKQDLAKYESGFEFPFIKKASHMLGSTAAPSAFAAEYPSEEMIVRLNSLLEASSSSYQVTSSMVQIRNLNTGSASGKQENLDILLSFGFSRDSNDSILPGKMVSTISRGWFCYAFFWVVLILYMSFEIRAYIRAH